ncbi:MAG: hypothetical protein A2638_05205 [Nitrospirae bacterium RIFCSPHIGHO2_01_FULL_66_17]|nr:MAG: hypothetical protein A2638_05205 [Nitrospirae bacterium RIFCSPHIGHO2_01_FULL_66_17]
MVGLMISALQARTRHLATWLAVLALTLSPLIHTHAGVAQSHAGDHAHPPMVHSVFSSDEAAHPLTEPGRTRLTLVQTVALHALGQGIGSLSGASTPVVFVLSPSAPTALIPPTPSSLFPPPLLRQSSGVSGSSITPRAPPLSPLS